MDDLWSRFVRFGKIAGIVGAIMTAIVGVATAWPLIEPWVAATRGYAREIIALSEGRANVSQRETLGAVRDIQIEQAVGKRDVVVNDIAKWNLELSKITDDGTKDLIGRQIRTLNETKTKLDRQIDTLNKNRWD